MGEQGEAYKHPVRQAFTHLTVFMVLILFKVIKLIFFESTHRLVEGWVSLGHYPYKTVCIH